MSSRWEVPGESVTVFDGAYDAGRERLRALYESGKEKQWDAATRLDWSAAVDPDDPLGMPDESIAIHGSKTWRALDAAGRGRVRAHLCAWQFSQFLHGEQGALLGASRLVQTVPDLDAKLFAATQVVDEARHVEACSRYLREKLLLVYPVDASLRSLLGDSLSDRRWDLTVLGMQVLVEGLALGSFAIVHEHAKEPLARALTAAVMQDEVRHVSFGRLALKDLYPQLTQAERDEREEFCADACARMADGLLGAELWRSLDLDPAECVAAVQASPGHRLFRSQVFSRVVPVLRDVGLLGPKLQRAFEQLGVRVPAAG